MAMKHILSVDKWLSEIAKDLIDMIVNDSSKECMVTGAMSVGKTTFLIEQIAPTVKSLEDTWLVFVLPGVVQLMQLEKKGIPTVCDGKSCTDEWFSGSTPDSLHKIMDRAKELGKEIWLVVDEAHAITTSSLFRKSFLNIKRFVDQCSKVIYMTATPQPLEGIDMGTVYEINRRESPEVPVTIQLVEKVDTNTVYDIVSRRASNTGTVYSHWNNIDNNNVLATQLQTLCEVHQRKVLLEEYQENMLDIAPKYRVIDDTAKAVSLHASNKEHRATQSLVNGELPEDIGFMCMTGFIKEGLNIDNDPNSSVVIVWDEGLTYVELVQTIGRYRKQENISEVVVIVKKCNEEDRIAYRPFETIREEQIQAYRHILTGINELYKVKSDNLDYVVRGSCSVYDPVSDQYVLSEELYNNMIYRDYTKALKQYPNIIKKALDNEVAINLKATIKEIEAIEDNGLNEIVKATKEEKAQIFEEILSKISNYDDKTLEELIEYSINQRLPENKEAVENMEIYHKLVPTKFKDTLKDIERFTGASKAEAFRQLTTSKSKEVDDIIADHRARATNRDIKELGIEDAHEKLKCLKEKRHTKPIARQVFIRKELQVIEAKRGRLSEKKLNELSQNMIDCGYYTGKKINLVKAREKLQQDLELIYSFRPDDKGLRISKVKI